MKRIMGFLVLSIFVTTVSFADHSHGEKSTLKHLLEEKKTAMMAGATDEDMAPFNNALTNLKATGILKKALNNGDIAPDFSLPNHEGNDVTLYKLLESGPVVLVWYRGAWCPYCNLTLKHYQSELKNFTKYKAQLVAISPQLPDGSLSAVKENGLEYTVVSDVDNNVASDFGLTYTLEDNIAEIYKEYGIDLQTANGNDRNELPLTATYVIDQNKKIRFTFLDVDYAKRAEPKYILNTLSQL
ncbi:MAG: peroxiredoxin [Lysobacterales bacterium]|jgi:peroxiredoxin